MTRGAKVGAPLPDASAPPAPLGPVLKIDFDMLGRPTTEVTELGFTAWPVESAASITSTSQGVTFTAAKAGANGAGLKSDWSKAANALRRGSR